ncbi:hypothetical protein DOQ73_24125, partial [Salmonella enterica subsp. enterica]|nr:hypothetical protein [Salmonella enterica subsp. enterica serovar Javiana]
RTPASNPKEVASWLRWDGLFAYVRDNLSRGSRAWSKEVLASQKMLSCPMCDGGGLRQHARLFEFAGRNYVDWLNVGTVSELCHALLHLVPPNERSKRRQARLIEALSPLNDERFGSIKLCDLAVNGPYTILGAAVASTFTCMQVLTEESL